MRFELLAALELVPATLLTIGGLIALLTVLWALSRLVAPKMPGPKPALAPLAPAVAPTPLAEGLEITDPRLIAIITAAATVALGRSAVVTRLTFTNRNTATSWAEFGRADIHLSHRVR